MGKKSEKKKNPVTKAAITMAGQRSKKLSAKRRKEIACNAAKARWAKLQEKP